MNIDIRYIDDKFKVMLNREDYKDVFKIIDYIIIEKYDKNNRTSSVPTGYGSKFEFPIGIRNVKKSFLEGIEVGYVETVIRYLEDLMPVKTGEKVWIDFVSRFLNSNNEELCEKEIHDGFWFDDTNYEIKINDFINVLNNLLIEIKSRDLFKKTQKNINSRKLNLIIPKPVVENDNGIPKRFKRKIKREVKDLI